jgi:hypothetical protein
MRRFFLLLATLVATVISAKAADTDLNIVKTEYSKPGVAESFRTGSHWLPLPDYKDRAGWSKLFGPQSAAFIRRGEKYLNYEWKVIPATTYLEFERTGTFDRCVAIRHAFIQMVGGAVLRRGPKGL